MCATFVLYIALLSVSGDWVVFQYHTMRPPLFPQGTCSSESFNAEYQGNVMKKDTRLAAVPAKVTEFNTEVDQYGRDYLSGS